MDTLNIDNINVFIILIVPGFISMKVYQLLVAVDRINISESVFEVISYSIINYALFFWVLDVIKLPFFEIHSVLRYSMLFLITFITPILLPICYVSLAKSRKLQKYFIHPVKSSWDFVFEKRKSYWIIIHLKSGEKIGGMYSSNSYTSSYPRPHEVFIEEVWVITENCSFVSKEANSVGALILGDDIKYIQFFR